MSTSRFARFLFVRFLFARAQTFTVGAAALALSACTQPRPFPTSVEMSPAAAQVARGAFLVGTGGCNDCHTPMKFDPEVGMPVPDMTRMLSGHPQGAPDPASKLAGHDIAAIGPTFTSFSLPFGVVYSANLTPDAATGLGGWTEDMFLRALRTGRHMGGNGRPIVPPMPWPTLARQSDADLKAIFAFLKTIPAIRNDVPAPKVPEAAYDAIAASYAKMAAKMKGTANAGGEAPTTLAKN